ncbi:DoxX family protein [Teredinibacter turnerae]|uniref:DoxD family protein n=1 Tax=Teredinibacter turnerae (strain ATCC 39867 / T7901) TaxID=377629 RepID=C5BRE2_TERTT|nr:DoxX family protein [Teredinibacter turnerae]ACR11172.1 DoxD family protein [Teredinibacter turnerae T7901]
MINYRVSYGAAYQWLFSKASVLHHLASLAGRLYVANVFFSAGLVKIRDWETTIFLFEEEYQVPLLSPVLGAYLGTFGELFFPILLLIGLGTRFAAAGLFVVNVVAVLSLAEIAPAAYYLHVIWGLVLGHLVIYGGGWFSADAYLKIECPKLIRRQTALY